MDNYYRDELLDHYKYPRNVGTLPDPDIEVCEANASCGDTLRLHLKVLEGIVTEVKYQCQGCVISTAVASMLSEQLKGMRIEKVKHLGIEDVYDLLGGPVTVGRIKCAGLMVKALQKAIIQYEKGE